MRGPKPPMDQPIELVSSRPESIPCQAKFRGNIPTQTGPKIIDHSKGLSLGGRNGSDSARGKLNTRQDTAVINASQ